MLSAGKKDYYINNAFCTNIVVTTNLEQRYEREKLHIKSLNQNSRQGMQGEKNKIKKKKIVRILSNQKTKDKMAT